MWCTVDAFDFQYAKNANYAVVLYLKFYFLTQSSSRDILQRFVDKGR